VDRAARGVDVGVELERVERAVQRRPHADVAAELRLDERSVQIEVHALRAGVARHLEVVQPQHGRAGAPLDPSAVHLYVGELDAAKRQRTRRRWRDAGALGRRERTHHGVVDRHGEARTSPQHRDEPVARVHRADVDARAVPAVAQRDVLEPQARHQRARHARGVELDAGALPRHVGEAIDHEALASVAVEPDAAADEHERRRRGHGRGDPHNVTRTSAHSRTTGCKTPAKRSGCARATAAKHGQVSDAVAARRDRLSRP
jgi:hypothetical protein